MEYDGSIWGILRDISIICVDTLLAIIEGTIKKIAPTLPRSGGFLSCDFLIENSAAERNFQ
jgi:hypothetical protein